MLSTVLRLTPEFAGPKIHTPDWGMHGGYLVPKEFVGPLMAALYRHDHLAYKPPIIHSEYRLEKARGD